MNGKLENGVFHEVHLCVRYTIVVSGGDGRFDPGAMIEGVDGFEIYGEISESLAEAVANTRDKVHAAIGEMLAKHQFRPFNYRDIRELKDVQWVAGHRVEVVVKNHGDGSEPTIVRIRVFDIADGELAKTVAIPPRLAERNPDQVAELREIFGNGFERARAWICGDIPEV